jgi:hypothetical protein
MITVFAAYYKQIGGGRELIKFFESRQDAEVYLTSDEYWGKADFDLDYRFRKLEEDFEIVERSLVDVLNEIYAWGKDTDSRLDLHSM